jgi:hypothetical protein
MALQLNNWVRHCMPAGPKCFNRCSGIGLKPELLSALKWFFRTCVSSVAVMWWGCGSVSGVKVSGFMVES